MKKIDAGASVYMNPEFCWIITMSTGGIAYSEPESFPYYLPPDVDNATLGHMLRQAFKTSRQISGEEFVKLLNSGVVQQQFEKWEREAMRQYGYKTKRAMYKRMNKCSIRVYDGKIEIQPLHHNSLDGYSATKNQGPFPSYIDATASDEELGMVIREGFARCTSII